MTSITNSSYVNIIALGKEVLLELLLGSSLHHFSVTRLTLPRRSREVVSEGGLGFGSPRRPVTDLWGEIPVGKD